MAESFNWCAPQKSTLLTLMFEFLGVDVEVLETPELQNSSIKTTNVVNKDGT